MARFIEVGKGLVNADRLLLIEPERTINTGEETGYARLLFDAGREDRLPLRGRTVAELLAELTGHNEKPEGPQPKNPVVPGRSGSA